MLRADAVMDACQPRRQVREDEMDDRHEFFGNIGIAALGDGVMIVSARPQAAVGAPIVGDEQGSWHDGALDEAAQRFAAAIFHDS